LEFIKQSIVDLNKQRKKIQHNGRSSDQIRFNFLEENYKIKTVYSHQETGIKITYERDKTFKICKNIQWQENINNGIFRALKIVLAGWTGSSI
jgi:deoxyribodipyrimidine photo-lyase